jgi:hypothetical protein
VKLLSFTFYCRFGIQRKRLFPVVGYNGSFFCCGIQWRDFPLMWDTTEVFSVVGYNGEISLRCGIQQKRILSVVGYIGEQSQDGKQIYFCCIPQRRNIFFRCILHHNRILCSVLYPRKLFSIIFHNAQVFFRCIPQWKIFSSVVGYSGRIFFSLWDTKKSFSPLWNTKEESLFHCGIQRKRFLSIVGYNGRFFFSFMGYKGKKLYNAK